MATSLNPAEQAKIYSVSPQNKTNRFVVSQAQDMDFDIRNSPTEYTSAVARLIVKSFAPFVPATPGNDFARFLFDDLALLEREEHDRPSSLSKRRLTDFALSVGRAFGDEFVQPQLSLAFDLGLVLYWRSNNGMLRIHFPASHSEAPYAFLRIADQASIIEPLNADVILNAISNLLQM